MKKWLIVDEYGTAVQTDDDKTMEQHRDGGAIAVINTQDATQLWWIEEGNTREWQPKPLEEAEFFTEGDTDPTQL